MRNLMRSSIAAVFIVAIAMLAFSPQAVTVNSNVGTLVQTQAQAQTMVLAARGDVIKETACSVLNSSDNVTLTTLAYMPSTTIKRTDENAETTFNSANDQDIGVETTIMATVAYSTAMTTATTVTTDYCADIGFVSEYNAMNAINVTQSLTDTENINTGATLQTCGTNNTATTTITGVNIRGATVTLTVDRETFALAKRTISVLRV